MWYFLLFIWYLNKIYIYVDVYINFLKIYGVFLKSSVLCKNVLDIGGKDIKMIGILGKSINIEI